MRRKAILCSLTLFLLVSGSAFAAEIGLTSVLFPDGKVVQVPMSGTQRAPASTLNFKVRHRSGQSEVDVQYKKLDPAVLFGGDVVAYIVWAVSPDGSVENLGGIANETDSGAATYSTARRDFALMITAEPILHMETPSDLVLFNSGTPDMKNLTLTPFVFGGLRDRSDLVKRQRESIAGMTYKPEKKKSLPLIQAEKAAELMDRFDAKQHDAASYDQAMAAVAEARETKGQKQLDASRRAVASAAQALKKTVQMKQAQEEAAKAAKVRAEKQQLVGSVAETRENLEKTEASLKMTQEKLAQTSAQLTKAQEENKRLQASQAWMTRQRDALAEQLSGGIGQMAVGRKTDKGFVVSLSGTAFPSGSSNLTTDGKYTLAKLSGILAVNPGMQLSVEGHTDSTGGDELNRKLSKSRADAVATFLKEMGVPQERMRTTGYGPDKPIAPNDTPAGRAKNRRVEIVLSES